MRKMISSVQIARRVYKEKNVEYTLVVSEPIFHQVIKIIDTIANVRRFIIWQNRLGKRGIYYYVEFSESRDPTVSGSRVGAWIAELKKAKINIQK